MYENDPLSLSCSSDGGFQLQCGPKWQMGTPFSSESKFCNQIVQFFPPVLPGRFSAQLCRYPNQLCRIPHNCVDDDFRAIVSISAQSIV